MATTWRLVVERRQAAAPTVSPVTARESPIPVLDPAIGEAGPAIGEAGAEPPLPGDVALPTSPADDTPTPASGESASDTAALRFVQAVNQDVDKFNPLLTTNPTTQAVARLIYPTLIGQDARSGLPQPTALATAWSVSDGGRRYRFALRDDWKWSDGVPVTAADVAFTFNALLEPATGNPFGSVMSGVASVSAVDEQTIDVVLSDADCTVLTALQRPLLPAHRYAADFSDLATAEQTITPTVGAGPFLFQAHRPGEAVVLTRNPGSIPQAPSIAEFTLQVIPDAAARQAAFAAGSVDLLYLTPDEYEAAQLAPLAQSVTVPEDGFSFLALNLAAPDNPQPGQDADGARLPQPAHPILGEAAVRDAIASALDYDTLLRELFPRSSYRLGSYVLPTVGWAAAPSLSPIPHDPAAADALLDAAGWRREATGAGTRARDGVPLVFTLLINGESTQQQQMADLIQADLAAVGIEIQVNALGFDDYAQLLLGQTFDAALAIWDNLGPDPGLLPFWHSRADQPGRGFNFVSFQDALVDAKLDQARTDPACSLATRAALYAEIQTQVAAARAYLPLAGRLGVWAVAPEWVDVVPGPWLSYDNVIAWRTNAPPAQESNTP